MSGDHYPSRLLGVWPVLSIGHVRDKKKITSNIQYYLNHRRGGVIKSQTKRLPSLSPKSNINATHIWRSVLNTHTYYYQLCIGIKTRSLTATKMTNQRHLTWNTIWYIIYHDNCTYICLYIIYYTGTRCVRLSEYGAETAKRVWIRSAEARCRPGRLGFPLWVTHHLDDFDQRRREREKKKDNNKL